ncbi:MAG: hypothetical protein AABY87_11745 [bacterium]
MERFDKKGMMIYPSPIRKIIREKEKVLVVKECYCPKGHSLINPQAVFHGFEGIELKVRAGDSEGRIVLSPIVGDKTRVAVGIDLKIGELLKIACPVCDTPLPVYSSCTCAGELITLFTTADNDYSQCVGICNRVDCFNGEIKSGGHLATFAMLEAL